MWFSANLPTNALSRVLDHHGGIGSEQAASVRINILAFIQLGNNPLPPETAAYHNALLHMLCSQYCSTSLIDCLAIPRHITNSGSTNRVLMISMLPL